jgi:hypothetical protein
MVTASWDDALERVRDNNSVIEKWNCAGVACKFQQSISYKLESWIAQHSAYSQTDSSRIAGILRRCGISFLVYVSPAYTEGFGSRFKCSRTIVLPFASDHEACRVAI